MTANEQSILTSLQFIGQLRIDEVELFRLDANSSRQIVFGNFKNRQHAALRLCADGVCGWSEGIVSHNDPSFQLAPWGACFADLKGKSVTDALAHQRRHRETWWVNQLEMAEIALLDLSGKLLNESVLTMLDLDMRQPVHGLFSIFEGDPQRAAEKAVVARKQNLSAYTKIKIFGESSLDTDLIQAVRQVIGPKAYLLADANEGYVREQDAPLDELVVKLKSLYHAGLNACEDPASLTNPDWIDLQTRVGYLDLIPDKPMRPAWHARDTVMPGMGRVYNLHPGSMGSLIDSILLARQIQGFGAQVMIGDDSLIGPGCTIWQQIGIGLGAAWVEAIEKPEESDVFLQCIRTKSTERKVDGRFGLIYDHATRDLRPGFGLEVDVPLLRKLCSAYCSI